MQKLSSRRPSPALVISILALFVALGGSAYAATKIGTKDIKKNAITAAKIKKNAVTTPKIKNNAITGAKINEGSLGAVPSATNAVNATNATNFSRYFTSGVVKAGPGQTVVVASLAPFTVIGKCTDEGGGSYSADMYLTTSEAKSFMYSQEGDGYEGANFEPGVEAEIGYGTSGTSPEWQGYGGYYTDWSAASPTGSVILQGFANSGVNVFGAACAFNANWLNNA